jgi:glycosyltransferase involved in cell wall biosynthesis
LCSYESIGLWRRVAITFEAVHRQADVNHITGDVHFITLFMRRKSTILTIHDLNSLDRLTGLKRWLFRLIWLRIPVRRSRIITVISNATRDHVQRALGDISADIRVIPDCLCDGFDPYPKPFNTDRPTVLIIGLSPNKNFHRVAQALHGIPCNLRVIGHLTPELTKTLVKHEISYTSASRLTDQAIIEEYRKCDLLVFASTSEGFGLPILEAQAVGRPVITSNVSPMPEVAGDGAELVDPFDTGSIRAGILRVISNEQRRKELVERGFSNARRFSATAIAEQYAELYREVAQGRMR